jgi:hypothetical protein
MHLCVVIFTRLWTASLKVAALKEKYNSFHEPVVYAELSRVLCFLK